MRDRTPRGHGGVTAASSRGSRKSTSWLLRIPITGALAGVAVAGCMAGRTKTATFGPSPEPIVVEAVDGKSADPASAPVAHKAEPAPKNRVVKKAKSDNSTRLVSYESAGPSRHDDKSSLIRPTLPQSNALLCPTVIYTRSRVAVAVPAKVVEEPAHPTQATNFWRRPRPAESWVKTVVLRPADSEGKAELHAQPVSKGRALFRDLSPGVYDVVYLSTERKALAGDVSGWPAAVREELEHPHRRIIVDPAGRYAQDGQRKAQPPATATKPVVSPQRRRTDAKQLELVARQTSLGWEMLDRGSLFNALHEFRSSVLLVGDTGKLSRDPASGHAWRDVLDARGPVTRDLADKRVDHVAMAKNLVRFVGAEPAMAETLYGVGKAYELISWEPDPVVPHSEHVALVCYVAATMLDSSLHAAANDAAVIFYGLGEGDAASAILERVAAEADHPHYCYNMGCILWARGRHAEARQWWRKALKLNPNFHHATFALACLQLTDDSEALTVAQCERFADHLGVAGAIFGADSDEARWARRTLKQLEFLGHELKLNTDSFTLRSMLTR